MASYVIGTVLMYAVAHVLQCSPGGTESQSIMYDCNYATPKVTAAPSDTTTATTFGLTTRGKRTATRSGCGKLVLSACRACSN
jgi:hypothetical protein